MATESTSSRARVSKMEVFFECPDGAWRVVLDPTLLPVFFFSRRRRDQIWGPDAPVTILRTPEDWIRADECFDGPFLLEGPTEWDGESRSSDCFCFEDETGRRYCVCGMT